MMAIVNALVVIPSNIINEFAYPIIYQNYADPNNKENIKKGYLYIKIILTLVFLLSIVSTAITYFFADKLILLISSNEYTTYWYLLPLLTFGAGLFYTGQTQTVLGMALEKPQKYIFPKILIGVMAVVLNFLLIKTFGLNGVAYSVIFIGLFYAIHIYFINLKMEDSFLKFN